MTDNWKSTIVFFSIDAIGHINPILSIAKELRRRGIRAVIITPSPLGIAPELRSKGFEVECCKGTVEEAAATKEASQQKWKAIIGPLSAKFRLSIEDAYAATYEMDGAVGNYLKDIIRDHDLIEAKLKSYNPDLVVLDHVVGVPCVVKSFRFVRFFSGFPTLLYSPVNENFVAGLGLRLDEMTPEKKKFEIKVKSGVREKMLEFFREKGCNVALKNTELAPASPDLNFYLGPKELGLENVPNLKPLPDTWFRLEHTIDEPLKGDEFEMPKNLINLPGKLIYFSLGSLVNLDVEMINRLLGIFSKSPNRFIISMGQRAEEIKLHPNMWGQKFINQKAVLPNIDLFITHGGHNSIIEAFYYGVPGLIVLPVFADQFDSAQRVADCGYGIRLRPYTCSEEEMLGAINRLLADGELKEKMKSTGQRLQSIEYHKVAADKLEQLLKR